jgi:hypothetical protein
MTSYVDDPMHVKLWSSIDQLGRDWIRNRKVMTIEDLEELFVSQMLTIYNVFSALLSIVGLCENG